jgi:hypothetical protein
VDSIYLQTANVDATGARDSSNNLLYNFIEIRVYNSPEEIPEEEDLALEPEVETPEEEAPEEGEQLQQLPKSPEEEQPKQLEEEGEEQAPPPEEEEQQLPKGLFDDAP